MENNDIVENNEPQTVSIEDFNALKATNERILAEHRADKNKYRSKLSEYEQRDQQQLAEQNDYKSLYEQTQNKVKELQSVNTDIQYKAFEKNLTLEVGRLAKDAHNPASVMRALAITGDNTDLENGTLMDLSQQIDHLRKEEPYLFNTGAPAQTTTVPRYMNSAPTEKAIGEMTTSELEKAIKAKVRARSQR